MTGSGLVLGIESSCDDTAAAVVEAGRVVRSSVVANQDPLHAAFRGVVPEVAGRAHLDRIEEVVDLALERAGARFDDLAAIAVTQQPGLVGSLLVGLSFGKALAFARGLPLVGVHHIEAHAYAATMEHGEVHYPALALVVSGGHTALYRMEGPGALELVSRTLDDAAGEAFDKVANLLGLGYPGGPALSRLAATGNPAAIQFPRYRAKPGRPGFSFSGIKTAVLYHLRGQNALAATPPPEDIPDAADVAASFEAAVVDALVEPTLKEAERGGYRTIVAAGGVAANRRLRGALAERGAAAGIAVLLPSPAYCTDNAAMIAGLGWHHLVAGRLAPLGLDASPRG
ncbi:MAG: tRNA (adenosine(37)-N6)-threonylcarbamoyltransferase complex transferase subunit TsaD [Planctomycetaceae bacterium]|nr:tRNA (adenosine(37)-N6)-threonylcarbamoyltransferase complex transferase subunit TsaD [Planctomycetaceae bacterium]